MLQDVKEVVNENADSPHSGLYVIMVGLEVLYERMGSKLLRHRSQSVILAKDLHAFNCLLEMQYVRVCLRQCHLLPDGNFRRNGGGRRVDFARWLIGGLWPRPLGRGAPQLW